MQVVSVGEVDEHLDYSNVIVKREPSHGNFSCEKAFLNYFYMNLETPK